MSGDITIDVGLNSVEFEARLNQVLVDTEIVMDDVQDVDDEADRVKKKVDALNVQSAASYRKILAGGRRVAMVVRGLAIASGHAMAEIYATGIEIAFLTAELLIEVATAESLTIVGAVSAAAKVGVIIALFQKVKQLQAGEIEAAARTEGIISALSALTFGIIPSSMALDMLLILIKELLECLT